MREFYSDERDRLIVLKQSQGHIILPGGWGRLKMTLQTRVPKISAHVNWGLSLGSSVRRPGSDDPIGVSGNCT